MELAAITVEDVSHAMDIIDGAKRHLREQGIDQWQTGYPDFECIRGDAVNKKGFFIKDGDQVLGYLCIDFEGEPAYEDLDGTWTSDEDYVVVHRMAFSELARGKSLSDTVFSLVERMSAERGVRYFRVDTDSDNAKMQHVLKKNGFTYRGTICFDNSQKIAFDKIF